MRISHHEGVRVKGLAAVDGLQGDGVAKRLVLVARRGIGAFIVHPAGRHVRLAGVGIRHHLVAGAGHGGIGQVDSLVERRRGTARSRALLLGIAGPRGLVAAQQSGAMEWRIEQVAHQGVVGRQHQDRVGIRAPFRGAPDDLRCGAGRVQRLHACIRRGAGVAPRGGILVMTRRLVPEHVVAMVLRGDADGILRFQRGKPDLHATEVGVAKACGLGLAEHVIVGHAGRAARGQDADAGCARSRSGVAGHGEAGRHCGGGHRLAGAGGSGRSAGIARCACRCGRGGAATAAIAATAGAENQCGAGQGEKYLGKIRLSGRGRAIR